MGVSVKKKRTLRVYLTKILLEISLKKFLNAALSKTISLKRLRNSEKAMLNQCIKISLLRLNLELLGLKMINGWNSKNYDSQLQTHTFKQ